MKWLADLIKNGLLWAVKNPVILILVIILVVYNHFVSASNPLRYSPSLWMRGDALWNFLISFSHSILTTMGIVLGLTSLLSAAALTVFEVESNFVIFAHDSRPLQKGVRAVFTRGMLEYFVAETVVSGVFAIVLLGLVYGVVFGLGLTGLTGALILIILVVIGYPTWYMLLSVAAVICVSHVSSGEKMQMMHIALKRPNLTRLFVFYFVRVGVETAAVFLALILASYLKLPSVFSVILLILVPVLPFAIIRTGAFLLKFDIFKEISWYQQYFRPVYAIKSP